MKKLSILILIIGTATALSLSAKSQTVISKFSWSSNPPTKAEVGPDAISISSVAVVSAYGSGEYGLNAGSPSTDINMVLPASIFNLKGMEFAIDFRREESVASFFTRGTSFDFGMNGGNLFVKFAVTNDSGGVSSINSGNIAAIPTDGQLHRYKFSYDNLTRTAQVLVDNVVKYSASSASWRDLSWNTSDNMIVGRQMDGTGKNVALLDNMSVTQLNVATTLPLKLLSFTASQDEESVKLNWKTGNEYNVESILIERSTDASNFKSIGKMAAINNRSQINTYNYSDTKPLSGKSYYRLKIVDKDGSCIYSEVKLVSRGQNLSASFYPNPAKEFVNLKLAGNNQSYQISVFSNSGILIKQLTTSVNGNQQLKLELTGAPGLYLVNVKNINSNSIETLKAQKL